MAEAMLLVRFAGGGNLSIEFIEEAPDDDTPRLGAWLELRAENPTEGFVSFFAPDPSRVLPDVGQPRRDPGTKRYSKVGFAERFSEVALIERRVSDTFTLRYVLTA